MCVVCFKENQVNSTLTIRMPTTRVRLSNFQKITITIFWMTLPILVGRGTATKLYLCFHHIHTVLLHTTMKLGAFEPHWSPSNSAGDVPEVDVWQVEESAVSGGFSPVARCDRPRRCSWQQLRSNKHLFEWKGEKNKRKEPKISREFNCTGTRGWNRRWKREFQTPDHLYHSK